jgi:uncharacterized membrane protein
MERFPEIDFTRGIALVMMLASNFVTDLQFFANYTQFPEFWWWFARITAFMFVFLVGLSLNISYSRAKKEGKANFTKYLKRGLFIFALGLLITVITYFTIPQAYIRFGVLHLIGISIILAYPFLKWKKEISLWLGSALIAIGFFLPQPNFSSVDYFPLLPWFGVVLLGLYFSKFWYAQGERKFKLAHEISKSNPICFLGRHTLLIYLLHQPIFIGVLHFLLGVKIF